MARPPGNFLGCLEVGGSRIRRAVFFFLFLENEFGGACRAYLNSKPKFMHTFQAFHFSIYASADKLVKGVGL